MVGFPHRFWLTEHLKLRLFQSSYQTFLGTSSGTAPQAELGCSAAGSPVLDDFDQDPELPVAVQITNQSRTAVSFTMNQGKFVLVECKASEGGYVTVASPDFGWS